MVQARWLIAVALIALSAYLVVDARPVRRVDPPKAVASYVPIRLALRQRNLDVLEQQLYAVSSPASPRYGQHLTAEEIGAIVGISHKEEQTLINMLVADPTVRARKTSIRLHPTRDYLDVEVPEKIAQEMVGSAGQRQRDGADAKSGLGGRFASKPLSRFVQFAFFTSDEHNQAMRLSDESKSEFANWQRLPSLAERRATYAIEQGKRNAAKAAHAKKHGLKATPNDSGTPAAQRAAYSVPANLVCTNPNNHQMVWGTGTYGFTPSDLSQYYSTMSITPSEINELVVTDFQGQQGGDNWGEGTLDVSLISGLAPGVITFVSNTDTSSGAEEGDGFGPAMLKWMTDLISNSTTQGMPGVISLSLGSLSWDSCNLLCTGVANAGQNVTYAQCSAYMQQQRQVCMYPDSDGLDRMNVEFIKIGALGTTVMAATGDGGSHFSFQFFNQDPIGNILNQVACQANFPTFPAESPFVVGVGGTDWSTGDQTPIAWAASGGGFSWRYPRQSYQDQAIEGYFATTKLPPNTAFNRTNRGYPDVAALATNVPVVFSGSISPAAGTSCSAPEFSALVSLLNDIRLNAGLSPLGFLLPAIYSLAGNSTIYPTIFYDPSTGNSDCDSNGECCNQGTAFQAAVGWDPTTGLGQPIFSGLQQYLQNNDFLDMFQ